MKINAASELKNYLTNIEMNQLRKKNIYSVHQNWDTI
jgi:hypothetical protein